MSELYNDVEYGFIIVNVKTARSAIPVEGAMVTIMSRDSDNNTLDIISIEFTNSSGMTPKLMVRTPPRAYSESPGHNQPYSTYTIRTDKVGYYSVYNVNTAVYSGITSIQPVDMIPLPDDSGSNNNQHRPEIFNISESPDL